MAAIQSEPQGLDSFAEGLASFQQQEIQQVNEPTAAVESASLDVKPKKHVTIVEPNVKAIGGSKQKPPVQNEEQDMMSQIKSFYDENQMLVMGVVGVAIVYYFYRRNNK